MTYYTPQPIACYKAMEMQGFRKGLCPVYENRVLVNGDDYFFTNIMLKRLTDGTTATVTMVTLEDVDVATVVPVTQTNYTLDDGVDAYEMLVLNAGTWTSLISIADGNYYLRIVAGANTWYTDAIYFEQASGAAFPQCEDGWVKLTWTDGRCISAGTSTDGITPIMAYPDVSHTFFIFLRANLSQPEWEYEEEANEDASKVRQYESRKLAKRWKLEGFPVSESVLDAIQSSALFETVTIAFPTVSAFTDIQEVEVESNWELSGCLAIFQYTFTTEYLLKQGCC